jgi:hypothetical protein
MASYMLGEADVSRAVWATLSLLPRFFAGATQVFQYPSAFTLPSVVGVASIAPALVIAVKRRLSPLFAFLGPIALSHLLVFAAILDGPRVIALSYYEGRESQAWSWAMAVFPLVQLGLCGFLIYRFRTFRVAASLVSVFTLAVASAAWFAALVTTSVD